MRRKVNTWEETIERQRQINMSATQINKCKENVLYTKEINGECFA
jgi:hypothetical protein